MRHLPTLPALFLPLLALPLLGCEPAGVAAALTVGSVASIGRTPVDAVVSSINGQDCSVVRLDRGLSYCRGEEPPPPAQPYCTRSIGRVDCWTSPPPAQPTQRGVADGPSSLTPAQEAHRTRNWHGLW